MRGEHSLKLVCYLRPADAELRAQIEADRAGGLSISAVIRDALESYYKPPAPKTDPVMAGMLRLLTTLSDSLITQQKRLIAIEQTLAENKSAAQTIAELESRVTVLQESLQQAIYDRQARKEIRQALESRQT